MAMVAEEERGAISKRTKAALAAAKARGVKLGGRVENLKNAELGRQKAAEARQAKAAPEPPTSRQSSRPSRRKGLPARPGLRRR
jgi:DNA invertase Pin-like site-specific DNA recombinase